MYQRNWRELIRPRALMVDQESITDIYGRFACEPLERGWLGEVINPLPGKEDLLPQPAVEGQLVVALHATQHEPPIDGKKAPIQPATGINSTTCRKGVTTTSKLASIRWHLELFRK